MRIVIPNHFKILRNSVENPLHRLKTCYRFVTETQFDINIMSMYVHTITILLWVVVGWRIGVSESAGSHPHDE